MSTLQQPAPGALAAADAPAVTDLTATVYVIPTDAPADLPRGCATQTLPPSNPLRRTDR